MGRKKQKIVGEKYGSIEVIEELTSIGGRRRFLLKCNECGAENTTWHSQISAGTYSVCDCLLNEIRENQRRMCASR